MDLLTQLSGIYIRIYVRFAAKADVTQCPKLAISRRFDRVWPLRPGSPDKGAVRSKL